MALPNGFKTPYEYFHQVNEFLKQNSWIYKEANTEFLKADILNKMPKEFQDYFVKIETEELNKFPYVQESLDNLGVKSIIDFRKNLAKLIPLEAFSEPSEVIRKPIKMENHKNIKAKKQHEIQRLAAVVKENLRRKPNAGEDEWEWQDECVLIDFGSGLGYLSELMYKLNKNILILGLEADTYRVEAAERRIKSHLPAAINSIQYRQQFITENSGVFIVDTVKEIFKLNYQRIPEQTTTKMAIIGLHACADLTITSMKLFLQLPHVKNLIIMPCCYHKLQVCDDTAAAVAAAAAATDSSAANLKFINFPISESLKQVLFNKRDNHNDNVNYAVINDAFTTYLNRPFLRLACQQTLKRWSKCSTLMHQTHGREMFLRAVAEMLKLDEEEMELAVIKRTCKEEKFDLTAFSAEQMERFESFSRFYALKRKTTNEILDWSEKHRNKFDKIIKSNPNGAKLAEGLTCLQASMQKLCENLVLYDRLCFMEETALEINLKINVRYEKIMDEELSPRCYVLIAEKL